MTFHGETATFSYGTTQVGGRWAVSSIALPNGETVSYTYASNKLAQVDLPDGTQSTFTWGNNSTAQLDTLTIFDAAATGSHRTKTVFFKQLVAEAQNGLIGSSNGITRMVLNGGGEVAYANFPRQYVSTHQYLVYEGTGRLKIQHAWFSATGQHFNNWTLDGSGVVTPPASLVSLIPLRNEPNTRQGCICSSRTNCGSMAFQSA